jgi:two-component system response regulator HydG
MKAKILVIDDEESIRFTFTTLLSKEGHVVLTAGDYESALDVISTTPLDLIFADIILGGRTGVDVLAKVRERGLHSPVVMITGEPNVETAAESVRLGAFDYIPKPVRKQTLIRITNMALHHKALADEKEFAEAEKEKYRLHLEAIFSSVKDAIVTVDTEMRVIQANEAVPSICGVRPGEMIGKRLADVLCPCNRSCHDTLKKTLKGKKTIADCRLECRHQGRPRQVVMVTSSPLMETDGKFVGAVIVVRDITRLTDLERELKDRHQFHHIVGTDTTVLITGESGTGKELVAKALHYSGGRAAGPLVTVNCSALSENLLESELFGHVKGAFTGAIRDKVGRFEAASGGTIFLDEIGEISPRIQLRLLRVLQEKEFERVGDATPLKVDVRVIACTNRDLKEKIRLGELREDLFYRLKVVEITLPPLRERREDIPLLVDHFCNLFGKSFKKNIVGISDQVRKIFMRYPWPGNVRELEHAIEHAFILCPSEVIGVDHLPADIREYADAKRIRAEKRVVSESQKLLQALEKTAWNKAEAARLLGVSRQTIYRKIAEYKLTEPME